MQRALKTFEIPKSYTIFMEILVYVLLLIVKPYELNDGQILPPVGIGLC